MVNKNPRHAEYYEAILQIRPKNKEVLEFALGLIGTREKITISKVKESKHGFDVYLSDQRFARGTLAQQLRKKFKNSKVVVTKTLYGVDRMSSRLIYRAAISFRLDEVKE
ncbi:MAG TPA: NMD3-related protein [Candidatus Nanoarchaeia archaeon]|nr:NMD3-related protein [Candidatus Nanoarchaeia archaeon]